MLPREPDDRWAVIRRRSRRQSRWGKGWEGGCGGARRAVSALAGGLEERRSRIASDTGGAVPPPRWAEPSHSLPSHTCPQQRGQRRAWHRRPFLVQPNLFQPRLLQAALPPRTLPLTIPFTLCPFAHALPLPGPTSLLALFHPYRAGFHISLLSLVADTVLMPLSSPEATCTHFLCTPGAFSGDGGGIPSAGQAVGA